jgi:diguanylate cyclase (GGDEF)-like protein
VHALRSAITLDRNADHTTTGQLSRLSAAVKSSSPSRIRQEATECVRVIGELIEERRERQEGQINTLGQRLESMRSELESVREQTTHDALTGIHNRAAFDQQLERIVDLDFLVNHGAFLFMMDIDHFKWVNDTHGHPCGDDVLKKVARALSRCFKRQDDFVARYGGEEFAALLRIPTLEIAEMLSERVMFEVRDLEIEYAGEQLRVTIGPTSSCCSPTTGATATSASTGISMM